MKPYPKQACRDCSLKAGGTPRNDPIGLWESTCDVCGALTTVTSPRDYRWPIFRGHESWEKDVVDNPVFTLADAQ